MRQLIAFSQPLEWFCAHKDRLTAVPTVAARPNTSLIAEFQKVRPMDTALQHVISDEKKVVQFYYSKVSHLISGIGSKEEGAWKRTTENADIIECESVKLYDVLKEHNAPQNFELLSIDVEGEELAVLKSMGFDTYKNRTKRV